MRGMTLRHYVPQRKVDSIHHWILKDISMVPLIVITDCQPVLRSLRTAMLLCSGGETVTSLLMHESLPSFCCVARSTFKVIKYSEWSHHLQLASVHQSEYAMNEITVSRNEFTVDFFNEIWPVEISIMIFRHVDPKIITQCVGVKRSKKDGSQTACLRDFEN